MDSITQFALGAVITESILGKEYGKKTVLIGGVLGTIPDLDVLVSPFFSSVENFTYHRGPSHAFFYQFIASFLIAWVWIKILQKRKKQPLKGENYQSFKIWLSVLLCFITHSIIDSFTVYGTKVWLPFSNLPVSTSSIFIIDPLASLPLLVTMILAFVWRPWNKRARYMLGLFSLYCLWGLMASGITSHKAKLALDEQNLSYKKILSVPTLFNTLIWRVIAIDEDVYYEGFYSFTKPSEAIELKVWQRNLDLLAQADSYKGEDRKEFDLLTWFSRDYYKLESHEEGILFVDLRFGQSEPKEYYAFGFIVSEYKAESDELFTFLDEAKAITRDIDISFDDLKNWFQQKLF